MFFPLIVHHLIFGWMPMEDEEIIAAMPGGHECR
jgi:hypothetical protein